MNTRSYRVRAAVISGASFLALVAASSPASSQDAAQPTASTPTQGATVADIVVTAQRRSQSLKDVPISVQAVTADQLSVRAVTDTRSLAAVTPTLNYQEGPSAAASAFSLRGITSVAQQGGIQPSTALVVDGVPVFRQGEFVSQLADIQRVEVLNGPQGTLFGKNSTAGVVNIVTQKPNDRFEGWVEGLATTDSEYSIKGMLNAPLSDKVKLRVNAFYDDQQPLVKNVLANDIAGMKSWGVSAKLAVDLTENLNFLLSGTYSYRHSTYNGFSIIGPSLFGSAQTDLIGFPIGWGVTKINSDQHAYDIARSRSVTGTFTWNLSDSLTLTSISNYTRFTEDNNGDTDGTPAGASAGSGFTINSDYPVQYLFQGRPRLPDRYSYVSQEVRANFKHGPIDAVVGAFYQRARNSYAPIVPFDFDGSIVGQAPGTRWYSASPSKSLLHDRTMSAFADLTYAISSQFKLFGGLRYTNEKVNVNYHRDDYLNPLSFYDAVTGVNSAPPVNTLNVISQKTVNNLSGRAGIQFAPTSDLNFYASYARGYKAPAADLGSSLRAGVDPIIKPETANAFEIGAKLRLFDRKVALNIALFHEVINNIQESVVPPGSLTLTNQLLNAGKLKTRGVEADAEWAITPHLRLNAALAYVKATYADFAYVCNPTQSATGTCPNDPQTGLQDVTGQPAIGSPKWKYSIEGNYQNDLGHDMKYFLQANWTWTSAIQFSLGDDPQTVQPGHGMLNASAGIKGPGDRWELQVFGKNLTNKFYYNSLLSVGIIGQPFGWFPRDFARYGGVKLTYRF